MHPYVNFSSYLIINILSWIISRWNKAGTWKGLHKTFLLKFHYSSWRDTWKKRKTMKCCSHQYTNKCKNCAICFIITLDRWFRPQKAYMRWGMIWEWPSTSEEQTKNKSIRNETYYTITAWVLIALSCVQNNFVFALINSWLSVPPCCTYPLSALAWQSWIAVLEKHFSIL